MTTSWDLGASHLGAPLLVAYLVGREQHARLRAALPGWSIVTTAANGLASLPHDIEQLVDMHEAAGVVLAGHSAGCQGVRKLLVDLETSGDGFPRLPHTTVPLLGVCCTDGTAANYPTPAPWQIQTWTKVADLARVRRHAAAFSCTQMSYMTRLPSPFMPTREVLRRALGVDLQPGVELRDGALYARGYPSPTEATDAAKAAHNAQLTEAMPMLLANHIYPFVGGGWERPDEADGAPSTAPTGQRPSPCQAILSVARADLMAGIREDLGPNDGRDIRRLYLDPLGVSPGSRWCASCLTSWLKRGAALAGVAPIITGSPGAKAIMAQLVSAGRWVPRSQLAGRLRPGWACVWDRSVAGKPETSWWGHVGIAETVDGQSFTAIEGNSGPLGDRVALMQRSLDDPKLLGAGPLW